MATLVDTNVLIDVFHIGSPFEDWSALRLADAKRDGSVVINPLIYAEMAAGFVLASTLDAVLSPSAFQREDLPWEAAHAAGQAFLRYRKSGGDKRSPLPDFYIGAHAAVRGYRILTRDPSRYKLYFPSVELITPETHP
ncbi:type II toxin-antitoxin system VapC family toxin [Pararhizobium qamdonense]|jgi:predicted nucleic acid-binding protein|uniref:type II toxin-antitoxin system VapC family toxin n=1 Tax=Pararhizobium qamdonense TaxID=3031126 RepID=UPI0023E228B8|nr:type II toxin-antitoxin system VapC family toxin [Pararhizobium qamdonense]